MLKRCARIVLTTRRIHKFFQIHGKGSVIRCADPEAKGAYSDNPGPRNKPNNKIGFSDTSDWYSLIGPLCDIRELREPIQFRRPKSSAVWTFGFRNRIGTQKR